MEVTVPGINRTLVGVTTLSNRDGVNIYERQDTITLYTAGGYYINGVGSSSFSYHPVAGDRLQVRVDLIHSTVEWVLVHPTYKPIGKVSIPEHLRCQ